jgi:hypothetical protein
VLTDGRNEKSITQSCDSYTTTAKELYFDHDFLHVKTEGNAVFESFKLLKADIPCTVHFLNWYQSFCKLYRLVLKQGKLASLELKDIQM